jgi:hypothetical protein
MKIIPAPLQPDSIPFKLRGVMVRATKWGWVVQKLPAKENGRFSPLVAAYRKRFGFAARMASNPNPLDLATAHFFSKGTEQVPRDILTTAALGRYFEIVNPDGEQWEHVAGPIFQESSGPVNPPPVDGYDYWIDASNLVTTNDQPINDWPDLTGNFDALTSQGASPPLGQLNYSPTGLPAVSFDGTQWMLRTDGNTPLPITRFWVGDITKSFSNTITAGGIGADSLRVGNSFAGSNSVRLRNGNQFSSYRNSPFDFRWTCYVWNGAASAFYDPLGQRTGFNTGFNNRVGLTIGALPDGSFPLQGHICEIIDYPFILTDEQRNAVIDHLAEKWITV